MNKKILLLFTALIFVLAGCVKADFGIELNNDGSGTESLTLSMEKSTLEMMGDENPFADMETDLKDDGYTVKEFSNDTHQGITASKKFKDASELSFNETNPETITITKTEGLFNTKLVVDGVLDLSETDTAEGVEQGMMNQFDFSFTLTLPSNPSKHNATTVDGKTLTWDLELNSETEIHAETTALNTGVIIIVGLLVVILLSSLVVIIRKRTTKVDDFEVETLEGEEEIEVR